MRSNAKSTHSIQTLGSNVCRFRASFISCTDMKSQTHDQSATYNLSRARHLMYELIEA